MIITIDGPAGTGKTTIARLVAQKLGFAYFDTGAMYRSVTYGLLKNGILATDNQKVKAFLDEFKFTIKEVDGQKRYFANDEDVTDQIRQPEVTKKVSEVSALAEVRQKLVFVQRQFGQESNSVFEGRDMGSFVFPQADVKIFLTARAAVRAERRYLELKAKHDNLNQPEVLKELIERDQMDSNREISPLKQAEDALLIDTSDKTIEDVVNDVMTVIAKKKK